MDSEFEFQHGLFSFCEKHLRSEFCIVLLKHELKNQRASYII